MSLILAISLIICAAVAVYSEIRFLIDKKENQNPFLTFCWYASALLGFFYITKLFVILLVLVLLHDTSWKETKYYKYFDTIVSLIGHCYVFYIGMQLFVDFF